MQLCIAIYTTFKAKEAGERKMNFQGGEIEWSEIRVVVEAAVTAAAAAAA